MTMHVVSLINNNTHLYPKRVLYCLIEHDKMLYVDVELFMHGYKCQTDLCDGVIIKLYCAMGILYKKSLHFPSQHPCILLSGLVWSRCKSLEYNVYLICSFSFHGSNWQVTSSRKELKHGIPNGRSLCVCFYYPDVKITCL